MRVAVLLCLALSADADTAGTVVALQREGSTVENGEVCRFPAGDRENPLQRWLTSQAVTCVATGSRVAFPRGLWNVFGRVEGIALSTVPLLIDGDAAPETLSLSVDPAASVVPLLPAGHSGVIYAPLRGSAFPFAERTPRVTVPAGEELWLFVLEKSTPISIVPIAALDPGSERTVDARSGGQSSVLAWLQVPEADRAALRNARGVSPPHVRASSGGPFQDSDPLPPLALLNGAFVRVRGVSAGQSELELGGRGWIPHRRRVNVASALSIAHDPLIARAAATVIVNWSAQDDLPALERSIGSCDATEESPRFEISVAACAPPPRPNEAIDPGACSVIRNESFDQDITFGSVRVEDVVPGLYRAEMRFGKLPPVRTVVNVPPLQQGSLRLFASYIEVYGSLTRGGEPLGEGASMEFPGDGVGFAAPEKGEYRAVLRRMIETDAQITVKPCRGAPPALVLADRPGRRNARFDIDIPANELTITVSDTFTRMPLPGSTVRYTVMSLPLPRRPLVTRVLTTAEGGVVITSVPEREIRLTVSHPGYEKKNVEPFSMSRTEKKTVDVQLVPLRGSRGKIVSQRPFESGTIFWFSSSGTETERADLAPDGTFVYARSHEPHETMTVVSLSHPVWTLQAPRVDRRQTVEIRFPDVAVREFDVSIEGAEGRVMRHIVLIIGGMSVPQPALLQHQALRGLPATVRGAGPLRLRDIAETGPIDLVLGPTVDEVPSRAVGMDLLTLPEFAAAPRKRLPPGATAIALQLK
jgi:hypothetical protein